MKATKMTTFLIATLIGATTGLNVQASNEPQSPQEAEALFWQAYNSCDIAKMKSLLSKDIEFYHDKNGLTKTADNLLGSIQKNLCSGPIRLRREARPQTVAFFPLNDFGAIASGEHLFYVNQQGKKERLDGIAKFTHVWQLDKGNWKISRVLSYDHKPAMAELTSSVQLSANDLSEFAGSYQGPQTGKVTIQPLDNALQMTAGDMQIPIYPQSETMFFHKQGPLTFEFVADSGDIFNKMVVRENGKVVEEALRID